MFQAGHLAATWRIHDMAGNVPRIGEVKQVSKIMRSFIKSSVVWQFAGGFVLGAIGLVALQPADATRELVSHFTPTHEVR